MESITEDQLLEKPKVVGSLKGHKLYRVTTKGGYNIIVKADGSSFETISTGPHPAICRHIAIKRNPDIQWTELSKSEWIDPNSVLVQKYEFITDQLINYGKSSA